MESVEAQHSVDALDSEAMESVESQESIFGVLLDSVVAMESDSISGVVLDSIVAMESVEALDSIVNTLDSDVVPDSIDMVPNYVDMVLDSMYTVDMVLDFVEVVQCVLSAARSTLVASSEKPATKLAAKLVEKFECELYIPDMEMLEMNGDTIILPDHVQMKLDKIYNMKKLEDAKLKQDAKKEHVFF
uniref:Uncharacterized protein n=1 Tax=Oryza barthii TaxID=65489 RepID=A0A0D3G6Z4_9ORYZ